MWAEGYAAHSRHDVTILKLSGNHWKWRMHGGAVTLARRYLEASLTPDVIVATDMLDLTTFLALTRERTATIPTALYFHENQLTYPWSPKDRDLQRNGDRHYGFVNVASAMAADRVFFNSRFHLDSFIGALPRFLRQFPDHHELVQVERIAAKSDTLALGLDLQWFDTVPSLTTKGPASGQGPLLLWNHRWEYDKNPGDFFDALLALHERGRQFGAVILGERFDVIPDAFTDGIRALSGHIVHAGYAESRSDYARWLQRCDIIPVTSHHDFFGASIVEAMYCNCFPLLPRRLAYPELIPNEFHERSLYDNQDDLVTRLDRAVTNPDNLRNSVFRESVSRFDWRVMAPLYDNAFKSVASREVSN
jgi:glycosyltransferase involved in cell wall biosynthesis